MTGASPDPEKPLWPDSTGANAGYWVTPSAGPVGDDDPSKIGPAGLYDRITHNMFSLNMVWVLLAGALVMFMQTGFALVEGGLCRAKNAGHTDRTVKQQTLPEALEYVWQGYPIGASK